MDNLRGHFPEHDGPDSGTHDEYEDDSGRELPPAAVGQDERRMQVRAYNFWAGLLNDRNFPAIDDLNLDNLPDFGPNSVLLDFTVNTENPAIRFLGAKLAEECGTDDQIRQLADVPSRSLLSRITDHYMQILANQAPIGFEAEFVNQRNATILYRGILLPYSSNGESIDFIQGVINWKELADQQTTDELLLEIEQALDTKPETPRHQSLLTEWADGPADNSGVLELVTPLEAEGNGVHWPEPAFGSEVDIAEAEPLTDTDMQQMGLADWLASARELALAAHGSEERSRHALYAAIGRAYDFSIAAATEPDELAALMADAGLSVQERAPMTPLVKLVFGADYDKTRLTEYAAALNHAHRLGLARGELAGFLSSTDGGLKAVVNAERRLRREESGKAVTPRQAPREALARKLRKIEPHSLSEVTSEGSEFTLLVARRLPTGEVALLGEIANDANLLERAARQLLK